MTVGHTYDTSVLVPALLSWHPDHDASQRAIRGAVDRVAAHVLLECYSVLTRLPAPHRISPEDAAAAISEVTVTAVGLPGDHYRGLIAALGPLRIKGGAVYDAVVAATALHHDLHLVTRDRRARATYDAVGVEYSVL